MNYSVRRNGWPATPQCWALCKHSTVYINEIIIARIYRPGYITSRAVRPRRPPVCKGDRRTAARVVTVTTRWAAMDAGQATLHTLYPHPTIDDLNGSVHACRQGDGDCTVVGKDIRVELPKRWVGQRSTLLVIFFFYIMHSCIPHSLRGRHVSPAFPARMVQSMI